MAMLMEMLVQRAAPNRLVHTSASVCSTKSAFRLPPAKVDLAAKREKLPSSGLAFGRYFSPHMYIAEYEASSGWHSARIESVRPLQLHPAAKVLHYACEAFEGMKAFRGVDNRIRLFRPRENVKRLNISAERTVLPKVNEDDLLAAIKQLVRIDRDYVPYATESEPTSLYIRPTLIGTEPTLGVGVSSKAMVYILMSPVGAYFPTGLKPVTLYATSQYIRAAHGGTGFSKMGSNYAPTIYVQKLAERSKSQQVLWLHSEVNAAGKKELQLTEVGTMNCFIFLKNKQNEKELITPPLNGLILPGVTRKSVLDLTRKWNEFRVSERTITMDELMEALKEGRLIEMFGTGTACVVSPIEKILFDKAELRIPCTMDSESLTKRILNTISDIQYGRVPNHEWCELVE